MRKIFELSYKDNLDIPAVEVMKKNVQELELLCKKANKEGFQVVLYSPEKFDEPENVYELSAILAEDMVKKYNETNKIVRNREECKQLAQN
jgi:hypothetical protein